MTEALRLIGSHWLSIVLLAVLVTASWWVFLLIAEVISEWHIDYLMAKRNRQIRKAILQSTSDTPIYDWMRDKYGDPRS